YMLGTAGGGNAGDSNYLIGAAAGDANTGDKNYIIGENAGRSSAGDRNYMMGWDVGWDNTGGGNYIIGDSAGFKNTGASNYLMGDAAGWQNTGSYNYMFGHGAGYSNTGSYNLFLGDDAGYQNSASYNTFVGYYAGVFNHAGTNNTYLGYEAGYIATTSSNNLMAGSLAGATHKRGGNNVFLGQEAGRYATFASNNTFVGNKADIGYVPVTTGMTATEDLTGNISHGKYVYKVSFVLDGRETDLSTGSASVWVYGDDARVYVNNVPTYSGGLSCTARKIYRTHNQAGWTTEHLYYAGIINDNSTILFTDTATDTALTLLYNGFTSALALGDNAKVMFNNQMVVGSADATVTDSYWGQGILSAAPSSFSFNGSGAIGSNVAGGNLIFAGGRSTGTATSGGALIFQTAGAGASSTALNSLSERMRITAAGQMGIGTAIPGYTLDVNGCINTHTSYGYKMDEATILTASSSLQNIFVGEGAGVAITSGSANTFLGYQAGASTTNSSYNTFLGWGAGASSTGSYNMFAGSSAGSENTGSNSVIIGKDAGWQNTGSNNYVIGDSVGWGNTGGYNYIFGESSGYSNSGNYNYFVGAGVGYSNSGDYNYFIGKNTGYSNTGGDSNYFFGESAGFGNTGSSNYFIGASAGYNNLTGGSNYFFGNSAGYSNTGNSNYIIGDAAGHENTGSSNYMFGDSAGYNNTGSYNLLIGGNTGHDNTGDYNVFVGRANGYGNTGSYNTFVGIDTGYSNTSGTGNLFLGYNAGYSNSTGSLNTFLGYEAGYYETGSNKLYIANSSTTIPLVYGVFSSSSLASSTITFNGKVGIDNSNPTYLLTMEPTGGGYYATSNHSWFDASSIRWKENVQPINDALSKVLKLTGVTFDWKKEYGGVHSLGFIAEEVGKIVPEVVTWSSADPGYADGMNYGNLTALLTEAVKEQQQQIEGLKAIVDSGNFDFGTTSGVSTGSLSEVSNNQLMEALTYLGDKVSAGASVVKDFLAEKVTAVVGNFKKVKTDYLELRDSATGEIYCVSIENGEWKKVRGECKDMQSPVANGGSPAVSEGQGLSVDQNNPSETVSSTTESQGASSEQGNNSNEEAIIVNSDQNLVSGEGDSLNLEQGQNPTETTSEEQGSNQTGEGGDVNPSGVDNESGGGGTNNEGAAESSTQLFGALFLTP
ncbi:MAG: tail fiber domain-containing protein, partial [Candidatus Pacebacteria bacterium]|nr:tail fiber domain-containing protein [Candidatus Paceibacterota bacterium]